MAVGGCKCHAGYIGPTCDTGEWLYAPPFLLSVQCTLIDCPDGMYGVGCLQPCDCRKERVHNPLCHQVNGACYCLPGYSGILCENGKNSFKSDDSTPLHVSL